MANTEILEKILGNDLCAKWINLRDYAFDKLSANPDIKAIMDTSDKKIVAGVPKLSSNTGTNGEASADRVSSSSYDAWKVFDDDDSTFWMTGGSSAPHWIQYKFNDPVCVKRVYFKESSGYSSRTFTDWTYKIQGSNDGTNWTDLTETLTAVAQTAINSGITISLENNNNYLYYRYYGLVNNRENTSFQLCSLQFYIEQSSTKYGYGEWVCEGQVPVMTSVTAPYGELSCSNSAYLTDTNLVSLFNRTKYLSNTVSIDINSAGGTFSIQYKFMEPTIVKAFGYAGSGTNTADTYYKAFTADIQISNDGTNWTTVHEHSWTVEEHKATFRKLSCYKFDNDQSALYVRIKFNGANYTFGNNLKLGALQFYAYQPKGNVPIMTSNTAPYGEAFSGYSGSDQWKIFDEDISTFHNTNGSTMYAGYKFVNPIKVKKARTHFKSDQFSWVTGYKLQASNDGSTWVDLTEDVISSLSAGFNDVYVTKNEGYYLYYREWWTCTSGLHREYLQFYGREMKASVPYLMNQSNIDNIETAQGMVLGSAQINASYKAAYAFKGDNRRYNYWSASLPAYVGYKFKFPFVMKKLCIGHYSANIASVKNGYLQASNNGTDWVNIIDVDDSVASSDSWFDVDNDNPYYYWRLYAPDSYYTDHQLLLGICQFFGFDYSERDWDTEHPMRYLYDHGVKLEEIEDWYFKNIGENIHGSDSIIMKDPASGGCPFIMVNIDTTDYSIDRACIGNIYSISDLSMRILRSKDVTQSDIAVRQIQAADLPDNAYLSISDVNGQYYVSIAPYSGSTSGNAEITEWWLE